jgi:hypothetical protein
LGEAEHLLSGTGLVRVAEQQRGGGRVKVY